MKQIKELIRFRDVSMFYKKVVWKRYSNFAPFIYIFSERSYRFRALIITVL